jgi:undecaprenyl-phosphate 4-deoxy-4-formamido-L-arabinose transferase
MVTGYSVKPLRFVAWVGFVFALFGFATLMYVLIGYFTAGDSVPGFPFLASLVAVLAGAQLFGLGVIGEYLGRMHFRSMQRPTYVTREIRRQQGGISSGTKAGGTLQDACRRSRRRRWR